MNIVGPLTNNGSVPVEATIKGIVKTRANPALTHVGALASDIVTLVADGSDSTEVRSDGSTSSSTTYFTVPSGRALVLTDVQWSGFGTPGEGKQFEVQLFPGSSFVRVLALIDAFDANGFLTRAHNMTTGIAVGPGVRIRFDVSSETTAYVHGYYVDTPKVTTKIALARSLLLAAAALSATGPGARAGDCRGAKPSGKPETDLSRNLAAVRAGQLAIERTEEGVATEVMLNDCRLALPSAMEESMHSLELVTEPIPLPDEDVVLIMVNTGGSGCPAYCSSSRSSRMAQRPSPSSSATAATCGNTSTRGTGSRS